MAFRKNARPSKYFFRLLGLLYFCTALCAQGKPQLSFANAFTTFMHQWRIPGASITVVQNSKVIFSQGFGFTNIAQRVPVQTNTLFRIASLSKLLTAAAIFQLIQNHQLSLDTPAFAVLNSLKPFPGFKINPMIHQITIRDLLTMSSGWDRNAPGGFDPMFDPWPKKIAAALKRDSGNCLVTTRMMMSMPMQFTPGTRQAYSNLNYCILGLIIAKLNGGTDAASSYEHYVQAHVLKPIGISDMQLGKTHLNERAPAETLYYPYPTQTTAQLHAADLPNGPAPILERNFANGGWIATSRDLAILVNALWNGQLVPLHFLKNIPGRFFPPEAFSRFNPTAAATEWAPGHYFMSGSFTGSSSFVIHWDNGLTYAVLFNTRPDEARLQSFRDGAFKILVHAYPPASFHTPKS